MCSLNLSLLMIVIPSNLMLLDSHILSSPILSAYTCIFYVRQSDDIFWNSGLISIAVFHFNLGSASVM